MGQDGVREGYESLPAQVTGWVTAPSPGRNKKVNQSGSFTMSRFEYAE